VWNNLLQEKQPAVDDATDTVCLKLYSPKASNTVLDFGRSSDLLLLRITFPPLPLSTGKTSGQWFENHPELFRQHGRTHRDTVVR
jgi:hypothetical protein